MSKLSSFSWTTLTISDLFFKHGCLHDLKVEILPLDGTTVLQVFHEQTFPT